MMREAIPRDGLGALAAFLVLVAALSGQVRAEPAGDDIRVELYHLADDRGEQNNLAGEHPERVAQMEQRMQQVRRPSESSPLRMLGER